MPREEHSRSAADGATSLTRPRSAPGLLARSRLWSVHVFSNLHYNGWQYMVERCRKETDVELQRVVADSILAAAGDAVVATDRDGIIQVWNPGAERIFGYSAREAIGHSLDLIIPERLRARHWEGFSRVMETGASRYGEGNLLSVPGLRKDGERISVEFTIVPLKDETGTITGLAAVMRDVTVRFNEIKALKQKLAEASRSGQGQTTG